MPLAIAGTVWSSTGDTLAGPCSTPGSPSVVSVLLLSAVLPSAAVVVEARLTCCTSLRCIFRRSCSARACAPSNGVAVCCSLNWSTIDFSPSCRSSGRPRMISSGPSTTMKDPWMLTMA